MIRKTAAETVIYMAGPFQTLADKISPYKAEMIVFAIAVLGLCGIAIGMKGGVRQVFSKKQEGSSTTRETLSAFAGLMIAGIVLGISTIAITLAVSMGESA